MFDEVKILLVEKETECPMCGEILYKGEIMYKDEYRGETLCHHCKEEYENEVIGEEGIDGRLLK